MKWVIVGVLDATYTEIAEYRIAGVKNVETAYIPEVAVLCCDRELTFEEAQIFLREMNA